jgi:hypothetical protein
MNKKSLLKIALLCVLIAASSSVAHATSQNITGTTTIGANATFAPSSNVTISVDSATASYEAYSQHLSGNRVYYSNNSDPKMYYNNKTAGSTTSVTPSATNTVVPTGYSSL